MADVFISYKRTERSRVERLSEVLRREGLDVWFDASLEVGRGEGFDEQIEREVTSAGCVVVCWTPEAIKSVYVKAEAKKGLDRDVLVPIFLEPCTLPVPFNGIDTANLFNWNGEEDSPDLKRVLSTVKRKADESKADTKQRMAKSRAVYERIDDKIYPGTLTLLTRRIAAIRERDAEEYQSDIEAVLAWVESIAEKEAKHTAYGYDLADRQSGGDAWRWWDSGGAAARSAQIARLRSALSRVDAAFARSQDLLERPAP